MENGAKVQLPDLVSSVYLNHNITSDQDHCVKFWARESALLMHLSTQKYKFAAMGIKLMNTYRIFTPLSQSHDQQNILYYREVGLLWYGLHTRDMQTL